MYTLHIDCTGQAHAVPSRFLDGEARESHITRVEELHASAPLCLRVERKVPVVCSPHSNRRAGAQHCHVAGAWPHGQNGVVTAMILTTHGLEDGSGRELEHDIRAVQPQGLCLPLPGTDDHVPRCCVVQPCLQCRGAVAALCRRTDHVADEVHLLSRFSSRQRKQRERKSRHVGAREALPRLLHGVSGFRWPRERR